MPAAPQPERRAWRALLRVLLATGALLLIPLVAMRFTAEVAWTGFDFAVAAALLAGTGLLFELAMARLRTRRARVGAGVALACALLAVWAELAVGIFH